MSNDKQLSTLLVNIYKHKQCVSCLKSEYGDYYFIYFKQDKADEPCNKHLIERVLL